MSGSQGWTILHGGRGSALRLHHENSFRIYLLFRHYFLHLINSIAAMFFSGGAHIAQRYWYYSIWLISILPRRKAGVYNTLWPRLLQLSARSALCAISSMLLVKYHVIKDIMSRWQPVNVALFSLASHITAKETLCTIRSELSRSIQSIIPYKPMSCRDANLT